MLRRRGFWIIVGYLGAMVLLGLTLERTERIARRVSVEPVTVDQMREIVIEAIGKEKKLMTTIITWCNKRGTYTSRVPTERNSGEDFDEWFARHLDEVDTACDLIEARGGEIKNLQGE